MLRREATSLLPPVSLLDALPSMPDYTLLVNNVELRGARTGALSLPLTTRFTVGS